jgi:hypothetical protein
LAGNGDGSLGSDHIYGTTVTPTAFVVADINGDGYADLAVATGSSVDVLLWSSNRKW